MSMILGEYKIIRKLGRGGFGEVYLVTDKQGRNWAIKQMSKKKIPEDQRQYIYNEIKVMKQLNSDYIVKLHNSHQTDDFMYIVIEFCNGGDLKKVMGQQPNRVFTLKQATRILSDIIRGLQAVHVKGYLHRDIKIENILVNTYQNGNKIYKIADFGLSKSSNRGETVLGTGNYMSPQIFQEQDYGFEVDMWAFGIVLYFMLNKEYPFKVNPHIMEQLDLAYEELTKQAKNFSYKDYVSRSKHKIMQNCTPETEDFFKRIFQIDPDRRITFSEIRTHPIFRQYFPDQIQYQSKIMYQKKLKVKDVLKTVVPKVKISNGESQNVGLRQSLALQISGSEQFPKQKEFMFNKNNEIEFLYGNFEEFKQVHGLLTVIQKMPLCYNLIKYYIILKRNFLRSINTGKICQQNPKYRLKQYFKTPNFAKQYKQFQQQLDAATAQFQILHNQCAGSMDAITKINQKFIQSFNQKIIETDFVDPFKPSYRKSTLHVFNKLKKFMKQETNTGNKYNYYLALAVISHIFNRIFTQKAKMGEVFKTFLQSYQMSVENINLDKLREWMSKANPKQLNAVTSNIIKKYFQSQ